MQISEYLKSQTNKSLLFRDGELWLEKCPICGGEAKLYIASCLDPPCHYTVAFVRCAKCRIRTDDIIVDGYNGSTDIVNDAIGYWNDRPIKKGIRWIIKTNAEGYYGNY